MATGELVAAAPSQAAAHALLCTVLRCAAASAQLPTVPRPRPRLGVDPTIGRHEVAPGVRRSCRSHEEPLRWWLNESKNFSRTEHR